MLSWWFGRLGGQLVVVDTSGQVGGGGHFGNDIALLDRHSSVRGQNMSTLLATLFMEGRYMFAPLLYVDM